MWFSFSVGICLHKIGGIKVYKNPGGNDKRTAFIICFFQPCVSQGANITYFMVMTMFFLSVFDAGGLSPVSKMALLVT